MLENPQDINENVDTEASALTLWTGFPSVDQAEGAVAVVEPIRPVANSVSGFGRRE